MRESLKPLALTTLALAALAAVPVVAGETPAAAAFERMKALEGEWQTTPPGSEGPATIAYRVISGGSVLMETMFPGSEHEMVNMIHRDGDSLVYTHYCAGGNQPRMRLDPDASGEDELHFAFADGTNLDPAADSHMHSVTYRFEGPDRASASWVSWDEGEPTEGEMTFELARIE